MVGLRVGRIGDVSRDGFGELAVEETADRDGVVDARLNRPVDADVC